MLDTYSGTRIVFLNKDTATDITPSLSQFPQSCSSFIVIITTTITVTKNITCNSNSTKINHGIQ